MVLSWGSLVIECAPLFHHSVERKVENLNIQADKFKLLTQT